MSAKSQASESEPLDRPRVAIANATAKNISSIGTTDRECMPWFSGRQVTRLRYVRLTEQHGFWRMSPDVVIEVNSETDEFKHTIKRIERFWKRGTKYAVAIDPETRNVQQPGEPPAGLSLDFDAIIDV